VNSIVSAGSPLSQSNIFGRRIAFVVDPLLPISRTSALPLAHLFRETSIAAMGRLNDRAAAVQATSDALPSLEEMPAHVM
jgi:hypothetical protein